MTVSFQTSSPDEPKLVSYHIIPDTDIHELIFFNTDRTSVQMGFEHILTIFEHTTNETTVRLLLDLRLSGMLPINAIVSQGRAWQKRVTVHPTTRLVVLARHDSIASLMTPIFNLMRFGHLQTHIFQGDKRDEAVAWLQNK